YSTSRSIWKRSSWCWIATERVGIFASGCLSSAVPISFGHFDDIQSPPSGRQYAAACCFPSLWNSLRTRLLPARLSRSCAIVGGASHRAVAALQRHILHLSRHRMGRERIGLHLPDGGWRAKLAAQILP